MERKKTGRWSQIEHDAFLRGLRKHGRAWKRIAGVIKTRTVVQIRTHAQKYFIKVAKETGVSALSTSNSACDGGYSALLLPEDRLPAAPGKTTSAKKRRRDSRVTASPMSSGGFGAFHNAGAAGDRADGMGVSRCGWGNSSSLQPDGSATPRTVAAATCTPDSPAPPAAISSNTLLLCHVLVAPLTAHHHHHTYKCTGLVRQRTSSRLAAGNETPRTREASDWLENVDTHIERAHAYLTPKFGSPGRNLFAQQIAGGAGAAFFAWPGLDDDT